MSEDRPRRRLGQRLPGDAQPKESRDERPAEVAPRREPPPRQDPNFPQKDNDRPRREQRPRNDRPRDDRPRNDRPRDDRPRNDRPRDDRPRTARGPRNNPALLARRVALNVLNTLDEHAGYLQPVVEKACRAAELDQRDRGFVLELTQGVCRWRARLDYALEAYVSRGMRRTPKPIQRVLRLGTYQLLFLDRIPPRAVIHTAVDLAREAGGEPAAAMVNAVLRKVDKLGDTPPKGDTPKMIAARLSHPEWLVRRWVKEVDAAYAIKRCAANNRPAPLTVRPDRPHLRTEVLHESLEQEGATVTAGVLVPDALHIEGHPDPFHSESFRDKWWRVQDEAAQLMALLLDPQPGETVWDVCAAPGGKTRHLARLMNNEGRLVASDVHPGKVERLGRILRDLGMATAIQHDATQALEGAPVFDRVLIDAPCSGLGVIRRHPEIKWRRSAADLKAMAATQAQILDAACLGVRPGGVLVYSVCTDSPEEGANQVVAFLERHPEFSLDAPPEGPIDWAAVADGPYIRTRTEVHGCDGFFAARFVKAGPAPGSEPVITEAEADEPIAIEAEAVEALAAEPEAVEPEATVAEPEAAEPEASTEPETTEPPATVDLPAPEDP